ncbi:3'(2'),5'-bisphosphate nucleotidase CysQ [Echinicola jeungdonensis]|uniref:3'(2'),5'-bisphosphate nucleotidase CysQ n=1 Tax=Echinicola jeungdonensis TaxID=709343 RepID=A0ABV5J594_9BACT|nr:3'(2'),5'-bisphosphate nucleotidase CysQ [Echinicola jeungdonensis]MDN3667888.1 3'(2'),5'-bisphosphate nucleotidase CysQ [Echinicola jeungdonensis]
MDYQSLLNTAIKATLEAGRAILKVYYQEDFGIELKKDSSPVTLADQEAHDVIVRNLKETGLPILSEEGGHHEFQERKDWEYFWMVDPLDGTKEFIKKNGEFTVNIALIHQGHPILGVIGVPVTDTLYWGSEKEGAWKQLGGEEPQPLKVEKHQALKTIVASVNHLNQETQDYLEQFPEVETISMGSSLKFMLLAEGKAQQYPRFAPTMEWDTAAAQAILEAAGGKVVQWPSKEAMQYNKENLKNPWFLAFV